MPISEEQRKNRRGHLGSSDMSAILGVDPWRNAYDVWLEKTEKLTDKDSDKVYLAAGNFFENGIIEWAETELGEIKTEENGEALFRKAVGFPIASHPDGEVIADGVPVEAKTAGLFGPLMETYGDEGTDELPDRIIIQDHVHMLCMDRELCHTPSFIGGKGFVMYRVHLDPEIMDIIKDKSIEFWDNYVVKDEPPPDIIPSVELSRRMKRQANKTIDIETIIVQNWLNAKHSLKIADAIKDGAESEMLVALGDAEAGNCELGMVTYFEQVTKRIDSKRLRIEKPEIAKEYGKESKFRVARLKKPKNKAGKN